MQPPLELMGSSVPKPLEDAADSARGPFSVGTVLRRLKAGCEDFIDHQIWEATPMMFTPVGNDI